MTENQPGHQSRQIALLAGPVLDIPPRIRRVLLGVALLGVVLVVMESLVGRQPGTIRLDLIIHFSGYALLAAAFVMALRPVLYLPILLALAGLGAAIEWLQPATGRSRDLTDALANCFGLAVGASIGLLVRWLFGYIRTELAAWNARRRLCRFSPGETVLREGESVSQFYVVHSGSLVLSREVKGTRVRIGTAQPGDMVGVVSGIDGKPATLTATAEVPTQVYRLSFADLERAAGGGNGPAARVLLTLAEELRQTRARLAELEARHGTENPANSNNHHL